MTTFEAFCKAKSMHPDALALIRQSDRYLLIGEDFPKPTSKRSIYKNNQPNN